MNSEQLPRQQATTDSGTGLPPLTDDDFKNGDSASARGTGKGVQRGSREEMGLLRRNSNWVNMVVALVSCLAVALLVVALVPRSEAEFSRTVDYVAAGETAQQSASFNVATPELGDGWHANAAEFSEFGTPATPTWYVSWLGPNEAWVTLHQAATDSEQWTESLLEDGVVFGAMDVGGHEWSQIETPKKTALVTTIDGVTYVVAGTATWDLLATVAEATLADIDAR